MSLRHEHKGTGGGSPVQSMTIVSPDESINVRENGDTTEIETNWDKIPIDTEDGFAHIEKDGSGTHLSFDLVTEEENGIARAFDKKILDHSFANVAQHGDADKPDTAVEDYLLSEDPQYMPEYGQILGWEDNKGKLRLSRMNNPPLRLPIKSRWIGGVYDDVNGTICIASSGDPSGNNINGDFCVAVRKLDTAWKVIRLENNERWNSVAYGNGTIVVSSGNQSREFMYSEDGGYTWTQKATLTDSHWLRVRFNPQDNYFYFIATEKVVKTQNFDSFTNVYTSPSGVSMSDITFMESNVIAYLYMQSGEMKVRVGYTEVMSTSNFDFNKILYDNGYFFMWKLSLVWVSKYFPNDPNLKFHDIGNIGGYPYDVMDVVIDPNTHTIYSSGYLNGVPSKRKIVSTSISGSSLSENGVIEVIADETSETHILMCEKDEESALFIYGGANPDYSAGALGQTSSDYAKMVKMDLSEFPPLSWQEIPVLDDKADGLLCAINGEFAECGIEKPYVKYSNGTLGVNASDRSTGYANYRLVEKTTVANPSVLWCVAELSAIVDGSTYVYDDEECTNSVGVITRHSYNPNNPNDVEVQIDGILYTYDFQTSKIPVSLATTKAIILALDGKLGSWIGESANLPPVGSRESNILYVTTDY